jgi:hypothetical protein
MVCTMSLGDAASGYSHVQTARFDINGQAQLCHGAKAGAVYHKYLEAKWVPTG